MDNEQNADAKVTLKDFEQAIAKVRRNFSFDVDDWLLQQVIPEYLEGKRVFDIVKKDKFFKDNIKQELIERGFIGIEVITETGIYNSYCNITFPDYG